MKFLRQGQAHLRVGLMGMKRGIETCNLRQGRGQFPHPSQCSNAERQVQGGLGPQLVQIAHHAVVNNHRTGVNVAAMHDAMTAAG